MENSKFVVWEKIVRTKFCIKDVFLWKKKCIEIINKLRFNEESSLFALERDKGLESIIGNIYQSFDGQNIYKSIEEKGANFLYLIVKNHVFADENKRIAATLFIYFLNFYGILYKDGKQTIK